MGKVGGLKLIQWITIGLVLTIAELPEYIRRTEKLMSASERLDIVNYLSAHPKSGDLLEGTGGIRKLRWGRGANGKSGGVKVIYYVHSDLMSLYLLTLFAKNERANISKAERNDLVELVHLLVQIWLETGKENHMSNAFDSIKQGLTEALVHAKTKGSQTADVKLYQPQAVNVSGLRERLSLTQEQFAARFGFSVATLRHWERGDRSPSGASLVLLNVIDRNPTAVLQALQ